MDAKPNFDPTQTAILKRLTQNLEDLVKGYRSLLEVVRKEKELLVRSDVNALAENTKEKDSLLYKIRTWDSARERYAKEVAHAFKIDLANPRLLELARHIGGSSGEQLRNFHSALEILVTRVVNLNKENELYAVSALEALGGAIDNVKGTLAGKGTYGQQGKLAVGPEKAGNFVSKEA